jgi:hypothetical protein
MRLGEKFSRKDAKAQRLKKFLLRTWGSFDSAQDMLSAFAGDIPKQIEL